jgi:hypothetical protein
MEYNEEQHITTDSTITTYILQHSCYSSVCLIAYASEQEFIKRLVTIYKFFLTSCQVPSIRTGHNLYYVKKSVPFTWNSWTSLVARNLNKNCSLIQPPTFDPK